jgi:hypothetical protein
MQVECQKCERQVARDSVVSCHGYKSNEETFECFNEQECNELHREMIDAKRSAEQLRNQKAKDDRNKIYAQQLMEKYGIEFSELEEGGLPCKCISPKWHRSEDHNMEFNGFYDTHGENGSIRFIKRAPQQYEYLYTEYGIKRLDF